MTTDGPAGGSILDVPGIGVGHHQRVGRGWQTGTTVVTALGGAVPGVDVRGGGPGTRETEALRPENLIQEVHSICLTGGSAFGLAAADGVMRVLVETGRGFRVGTDPDVVVPVVPAAVIFDLGRGGRVDLRPDDTFGEKAARASLSTRRRVAWGAVGAGAGARAGVLQGGVGTASAVVTIPGAPAAPSIVPGASRAPGADVVVTLGAVAVVNASGSPVDMTTAEPWVTPGERLPRPSAAERSAVRSVFEGARSNRSRLNTTIGVVATDARLDKAEATKVAAVAHDGLARAIRPAHALTDGDTIFCLANGTTEIPTGSERGFDATRVVALDHVLAAAADVFARACTHAFLSATTIGGSPAYRDLCPSVFR